MTPPESELRGGVVASRILLGFLRAYRACLSPFLGQACRFEPSCSRYAEQAVSLHGPVRGSWLALRRVGRCHPFRPGGLDLVP